MTSNSDPILAARRTALQRLDRRECSTGDIIQFLRRKGFESEIITQVVRELVERKYIDNEKYANLLIREQALRGKGPTWMQMKLREKGIRLEREVIESSVTSVANTTELEIAQEVVARRYPGIRENPTLAKKALLALLRRGFSYDVARKALATFDQSFD
jgi:regulatory protein